MLPRLLPRLQAKYPNLRLEVRETQTKLLIEELTRGELDAVMLALPAEGADIETLALFDDAFLLAVPAADALPARGRINVDDVDQRRLILLEEGHCLRDQALAFCATKRRDQPARSRRHLADDGDADGGERLWRDAAAGSRGRRRSARRARQAVAFRRAGAGPHHRAGLAAHLAAEKDFEALGQIIMEMTGGKTPVRPSTRTASGNRGRS